jgi:hypothetical protein
VNTTVTIASEAEGMQTTPSREPFMARLQLTLGALVVFMALVDLVTGSPPVAEVAVAFGASIGLGLEAQAIRGAHT